MTAATRPGTKARNIRIPDDLWDKFRVATEKNGTSASAEVNGYIRDYVRNYEMTAAATLSVPAAMRSLLSFALDVIEREGFAPWGVEVTNRGLQLRVSLEDVPRSEADRLAVALGVTDLHTRDNKGIYTVGSKAVKESWHKEQPPYFGESVAFMGRLVEVTVTVFGGLASAEQ